MGALRLGASLSEDGERPPFCNHGRTVGELLFLLKRHIVMPVPFLV